MTAQATSLIERLRHHMAVPTAAIAFGGLALALFAVPRPVAPIPEILPRQAEMRPEAAEAIRTIPLPSARLEEPSPATGSIVPPAKPDAATSAPTNRQRVVTASAAPMPPRRPQALRDIAEAKPVARDKPAPRRPIVTQPGTQPSIARAPAEPATILGKTLALGSDALDLTIGGARYAKSAALRVGGAVVDLIED